MSFSRVSAVRTALRLSRSTRPALSKPQQWQRIAQRTYATGGHEPVKSSSDLPWQIGALVGTGLGCTWLLSGEHPKPTGGHGDHHDEKHEEHEEESEETSEKPADSEEEPKEESKSDDDSSSDNESGADTPATSDDETVGETDENVKKSIPDAKGGNKIRLESKNAIKQGEEKDTAESDVKDQPATSKEPGGGNTMSGKQEGLSNTDTKHSTDIAGSDEKSTKGEGVPETAKVKGTVDPNRPQDGKES